MNSYQVGLLENELNKILSVSGVIGVAIVDRNGLTIASQLPRTYNEKSLGAMSATMFEAMESATPQAEETLSNLTVEYDDFQVIITTINLKVLFVSIIEYNIDLGLTLIEIEEFIKKLSKYLGV